MSFIGYLAQGPTPIASRPTLGFTRTRSGGYARFVRKHYTIYDNTSLSLSPLIHRRIYFFEFSLFSFRQKCVQVSDIDFENLSSRIWPES